MKAFLSKDTLKIVEKYENAEPFETINDIEIVAIDRGDLDFLLGYTLASLKIERKLKEKVEQQQQEIERLKKELRIAELGEFFGS